MQPTIVFYLFEMKPTIELKYSEPRSVKEAKQRSYPSRFSVPCATYEMVNEPNLLFFRQHFESFSFHIQVIEIESQNSGLCSLNVLEASAYSIFVFDGDLDLYNDKEQTVASPRENTFYFAYNSASSYKVKFGAGYTSFMIVTFNPDYIIYQIINFPKFEMLCKRLESKSPFPVVMPYCRIGYAVRTCLYKIHTFSCRDKAKRGVGILQILVDIIATYNDLIASDRFILNPYSDERVQSIRKFVTENYQSYKINDISYVAKRIGIAEWKLRKMSASIFGKTLYQYITDLRMQKALTLLGEGKKVKNVSRLVGYEDASYFSRAFKRYFGISPRSCLSCND